MIGEDANTSSFFQRSLFQTTVSLFFPESMKMIHVSISMFFIYFLSVTLRKNILVKCTRNCYLFSKIYTKKINEFQIWQNYLHNSKCIWNFFSSRYGKVHNIKIDICLSIYLKKNPWKPILSVKIPASRWMPMDLVHWTKFQECVPHLTFLTIYLTTMLCHFHLDQPFKI